MWVGNIHKKGSFENLCHCSLNSLGSGKFYKGSTMKHIQLKTTLFVKLPPYTLFIRCDVNLPIKT